MVSLEEFFDLFCEELDETDPESIGMDTDFKAISEWDSLTALSVISMVDEEFEILLTGKDMEAAVTIKDLYDLIQGKL